MGRKTRQTKKVTVPFSHVLLPKPQNNGFIIEPSKIPIYKDYLIRNKMVNANIYHAPDPPGPPPPPDPLDKLPKIKINCLQMISRDNPWTYYKPQLEFSNYDGAQAGSTIWSARTLALHDQYFLVAAKVSSKFLIDDPPPDTPYQYQVWSLYSPKHGVPSRPLTFTTIFNLLEYHIYSITPDIAGKDVHPYFQLNFFTPPQDPGAFATPFINYFYFHPFLPTIDDQATRNFTLSYYSPIPTSEIQPTIPPMPPQQEGYIPCLIFDGRYYEWEVNPDYP